MKKVALAVIKHKGKVLMVRRKWKKGDLHWQFPGGYIKNEEETVFVAASREAKEESGITCEPIRIIGERIHPSTKEHLCYIQCDYKSGQAKVSDQDEVDRVKWMTPNEVLQNVTSDLFHPVLEFIFDRYEKLP